ncbi:MAG: hypothetical protein KAT28_05810 [Candidatus Aenigmarchaeota archaeon]|nr:hypothetical protein [Candidatus Aenigmarchaeota archaeon]
MEKLAESDSKEISIDSGTFGEIVRLSERLESLIETVEIKNDKKLMEGLNRSREDLKQGKVHELKNLSDLWK